MITSLKDDPIYCSQLRLRVERVSAKAKRIGTEADALYRLAEWSGGPIAGDVRSSLEIMRAAAEFIIDEVERALAEVPSKEPGL